MRAAVLAHDDAASTAAVERMNAQMLTATRLARHLQLEHCPSH